MPRWGAHHGGGVDVDTTRLRNAAALADYPLSRPSVDAGLDYTAMTTILRRGRCGYYTLDAISCQLLAHPSEFMAVQP